ncbi:hypothetical protein BD769DRAFT_1638325 [Suillus cothurnatus]|nr:hypothetical protein BD769DRAFT_1638325 [Suillus cothurnatus]
MVPLYLCSRRESMWNTGREILVHSHIPVHSDTSAFIFFQNGLRANPDEGAMGCSNKRTEPTGELYLKKVKDKWGLVRVTYIVALSNRMLMDVMIDLERMQPFEEKCNGRLSLLASKVLADSRGIVWMYEPTPSEDTAPYALTAYVLCGSLPSVPQEAHSEEASVKENVREAEGDNTSASSISTATATYIICGAFVLVFSGALGRYAQFGRDFAFGCPRL